MRLVFRTLRSWRPAVVPLLVWLVLAVPGTSVLFGQ
jgi:hypothetical protein